MLTYERSFGILGIMKTNQVMNVFCAMFISLLAGCATETSNILPIQRTEISRTEFSGKRTPISIGNFQNRSSYMRGIFSEGGDRLGGQAQTILITHLQQTNRFNVLDRANLQEIEKESLIKKTKQNLKGANYVVTGDVTEFAPENIKEFSIVKKTSADQVIVCGAIAGPNPTYGINDDWRLNNFEIFTEGISCFSDKPLKWFTRSEERTSELQSQR